MDYSENIDFKCVDMLLSKTGSQFVYCMSNCTEFLCTKDCKKCGITYKSEGDMSLVEGDYKSALKKYKKAVFFSPGYAEAWTNMGIANTLMGWYRKGIDCFKYALIIDEYDVRAMFGTAIAFKALGNYNQSMEMINNLLDIYDDEDVESFKQYLVSIGTLDTDQKRLSNGRLRIHNREELGVALQTFVASSEFYEYIPPNIARVHHCISTKYGQISIMCDVCGKIGSVEVNFDTNDPEGVFQTKINRFKGFAEKFSKMGYPADVKLMCDECSKKVGHKLFQPKPRFLFSIRVGEDIFDSYPADNTTVPYETAVAFFGGYRSMTELSKKTRIKFSPKDFANNINFVFGNEFDTVVEGLSQADD